MILIVGAGNIGCLIGYLLQRSGQNVLFLDKAKHIRQMQTNGVRITGIMEDRFYPLSAQNTSEASRLISETGDKIDFAFVIVKAYDTKKAVSDIASLINTNTTIICLQNGIGTEKIAKKLLHSHTILRGLTSMGAFRTEVGTLNWSGRGETLIGYSSELERKKALSTVGLFSDIAVKIEPNIVGAVFTKTIVNCAINPIAAVHNVRNMEIYENPSLRHTAEKLAYEAWKVAEKMKIKLTTDNPIRLSLEVAKNTGNNINSMLYDVRNHRETEIEFLNGKIVRLGKLYDVQVPTNSEYYQKIINLTSATYRILSKS